MRFIAVGNPAEGFIAVGQEAVGIVAIGQFATGVIALGQVARGLFAVGQVAVGLFTLGQLALGLHVCVAMVGAGGRGLGGVIPLVPVPPRRKKVPPIGTLNDVATNGSGWVEATLQRHGDTGIVAVVDDRQVPLRVEPELFLAAYGVAKGVEISGPVWLELASSDAGRTFALRSMMRVEKQRSARGWFVPLVQLGLLLGAAAAVIHYALLDLVDACLRLARDAATNGLTFD